MQRFVNNRGMALAIVLSGTGIASGMSFRFSRPRLIESLWLARCIYRHGRARLPHPVPAGLFLVCQESPARSTGTNSGRRHKPRAPARRATCCRPSTFVFRLPGSFTRSRNGRWHQRGAHPDGRRLHHDRCGEGCRADRHRHDHRSTRRRRAAGPDRRPLRGRWGARWAPWLPLPSSWPPTRSPCWLPRSPACCWASPPGRNSMPALISSRAISRRTSSQRCSPCWARCSASSSGIAPFVANSVYEIFGNYDACCWSIIPLFAAVEDTVPLAGSLSQSRWKARPQWSR